MTSVLLFVFSVLVILAFALIADVIACANTLLPNYEWGDPAQTPSNPPKRMYANALTPGLHATIEVCPDCRGSQGLRDFYTGKVISKCKACRGVGGKVVYKLRPGV